MDGQLHLALMGAFAAVVLALGFSVSLVADLIWGLTPFHVFSLALTSATVLVLLLWMAALIAGPPK